MKSSTLVLQNFVRVLSLVDSDYPNDLPTWRECINALKRKGSRVITDLMLLPQKIVSGKADFDLIWDLRDSLFGEAGPADVEIQGYQREVREILKIMVNLVQYAQERSVELEPTEQTRE